MLAANSRGEGLSVESENGSQICRLGIRGEEREEGLLGGQDRVSSHGWIRWGELLSTEAYFDLRGYGSVRVECELLSGLKRGHQAVTLWCGGAIVVWYGKTDGYDPNPKKEVIDKTPAGLVSNPAKRRGAPLSASVSSILQLSLPFEIPIFHRQRSDPRRTGPNDTARPCVTICSRPRSTCLDRPSHILRLSLAHRSPPIHRRDNQILVRVFSPQTFIRKDPVPLVRTVDPIVVLS